MAGKKKTEEELEKIEPMEDAIDDEEDFDEEAETDSEEVQAAGLKSFAGTKLPWLINDFEGLTDNVYEGIMVAASRARQIGRRQKQEIDIWYKSHEPVDGAGEEEESEPGVDHFHHIKPTVKSLDELSSGKLTYKHLDKEES